MKIIYHCFGSAHSSVLAAAIHVGILPIDRIPAGKEIIAVPHYDQTTADLIGTIFYFGTDEMGNQVYIMGMGKARRIVKNTLLSFMELEQIPEDQVYLVNTLDKVNILVRIGGYLSRGIGMVFPGRYLTVLGLKIAYHKFVSLVKRVKDQLSIA